VTNHTAKAAGPSILIERETKSPLLSTNPYRIPELDGLRGLAILLVIICHYVGESVHTPLDFPIHQLLSATIVGWSGVDLFFVLSGFLIGGILLDARSSPHYFQTFYMRRVYRILPIYYSWILIYGVLISAGLWLLPGRFPVSPKDLLQIPLHLFFLQNLTYSLTPFQWIWFSVTWSLAVEEQFYMLAPPLIRFLSERKLVYFLGATVCLTPLLRAFAFRYLSEGYYVSVFTMPCRADALACGVLLAIAWRRKTVREFLSKHPQLLMRVQLILFFGFGLLLWWLAHPVSLVTLFIGYTWVAFLYSCLLLVTLTQPRGSIAKVMRWKALRGLGTISYCVYLIHFAANHLLHRFLLHARPQVYNPQGVAVTLLAFALTLSAATVSWHFFEKPLIRRGHRYSYSSAAGE